MPATRPVWIRAVLDAVVAAAVVCALSTGSITLVAGVSCNCNFGTVAQATPVCECNCDPGFASPRCDYKTEDKAVRIETYLAIHPDVFVTDPFIEGLQAGLGTMSVATKNVGYLRKVNKTNVVVAVPGFVVSRFLTAVERNLSWVFAPGVRIEAAYVVPLPQTSKGRLHGLPAFTVPAAGRNVVITVEGLLWIIGAFCVAFVLCCCESSCLKNEEMYINNHGYKPAPPVDEVA